MTAERLKEWADSLSLDEIYAAGEARMVSLDSMGGAVPDQAYNLMVDMAYLLDACLARAGYVEKGGPDAA